MLMLFFNISSKSRMSVQYFNSVFSVLTGKTSVEEVLLMFRKRHSFMGMDMDMGMDPMSVMKVVAAGALLIYTAKFMFDEMMD